MLRTFSYDWWFSWIYWTVINICTYEILDYEIKITEGFVQGFNSLVKFHGVNQSKELSSFYGCMASPDATHFYVYIQL